MVWHAWLPWPGLVSEALTKALTGRAGEILTGPGEALWREVVESFALDRGDATILERACRCLDEIGRLEAAAAEGNPLVPGSQGQPTANPAWKELREHHKSLVALLEVLGVPASLSAEDAALARSHEMRPVAYARWRK